MKIVEIYTADHCPYCKRAKNLLDSKGIEYNEVKLDDDPSRKQEFMDKLKWRTIPIIVIDGKLIGGYDQLAELVRSNKLNELIN